MNNPTPIIVGGQPFPSFNAAAQALNLSYEGLRKAFQSGRDAYMGFTIDYADWDVGEAKEPVITVCPRLDAYLERRDRMHTGGLLGRTEVAR